MTRVLVAGATGYLGRFVVREFKERGDWVRALARDPAQLRVPGPALAPAVGRFADDVYTGEVTRPETLYHLCDGIDVVFSSVGITRQTDPMTYMGVDYRGNKNLLDLAIRSGVRKFIYVHIFNAAALQHLRNVRAKQRFVDELSVSGLGRTVICPTGYFNDMAEVFRMAERGTAYVIGDARMNPIHGADLAGVCADAVARDRVEVPAGGRMSTPTGRSPNSRSTCWASRSGSGGCRRGSCKPPSRCCDWPGAGTPTWPRGWRHSPGPTASRPGTGRTRCATSTARCGDRSLTPRSVPAPHRHFPFRALLLPLRRRG